jgi:hypothetical protein
MNITNPSQTQGNLSLYRFPLIYDNKRLSGIRSRNTQLDLDLSKIVWENITDKEVIIQIFKNHTTGIETRYT